MAAKGQDKKTAASIVSRRDFLRAGGLSVVGLSVAEKAALARLREQSGRKNCILLLMTGGPSQLETFDPKPDAPAHVRGPLKSIETAVPGLQFSEAFPRLAERANRLAVVRTLHHDAAPIHETGLQLLQTGRLAKGETKFPAFGAIAANALGSRGEIPPYVVLPKPITNTGVNIYRGEGAGLLGDAFEPVMVTDTADGAATDDDRDASESMPSLLDEAEQTRRAYGDTRCGRLCLKARQLVECGVRTVTVNMFDRLAGQLTWDCHGRAPWGSGTLYDYRDELGPAFDRAMAALLDDLASRGLLDDTLVVATGEFGRTPYINEHGGRDHWPGVWSGLLAGGGIEGDTVIGRSDRLGAEPQDRPVHVGELTATIIKLLGVDPAHTLTGDDETQVAAAAFSPIDELIG
jgi:uncharacterized protein (DUF1501 family)